MSVNQRVVPGDVREQIKSAYRLMAEIASYRPAAPTDGFGNITVPEKGLDLEREAERYAQTFWREEDDCKFWIGSCAMSTRPATIFAIEAAKNMCGGSAGDETALRLLTMAVQSLEEHIKEDAASREWQLVL